VLRELLLEAQWPLQQGDLCSVTNQTSAGVPRNEPGSPGAGMVGRDQLVSAATAAATSFHSADVHPWAEIGTDPSDLMRTNAGSSDKPSAFTATRSGSQNTKNSSANGPRNARASLASEVTMKLMRTAAPEN